MFQCDLCPRCIDCDLWTLKMEAPVASALPFELISSPRLVTPRSYRLDPKVQADEAEDKALEILD